MKILRIFIQNIVIILIVTVLICECISEEIDNDNNEEGLAILAESEPHNITCTRRQNSKMHEIMVAISAQYPFMAAILSQQSEYICSGTVVSTGLILTTAKCAEKPINYVLLNTITDKKTSQTPVLQITKSVKFPTYTGEASQRDVAVIYTETHNNSIASKIKLSNYTDGSKLVDVEAIGYGLNADIGQPKDLQHVGLEVRALFSTADEIKAYIDCIDTKVNTCFKDTGGPVIVDNELVGIVIRGEYDCTQSITSMYAINKHMTDILPTYVFKSWLEELIKKNEDREPIALMAYPLRPSKPIVREMSAAELEPEARKEEIKETTDIRNAGSRVQSSLCLALLYSYCLNAIL